MGTWKILGESEIEGSAAVLEVDNIPANDYLHVEFYADLAFNNLPCLVFNTSGYNNNDHPYTYFKSEGTDSTGSSASQPAFPVGSTAQGKCYAVVDITNKSGIDKMIIAEAVDFGGAGAGNAPERSKSSGKYLATGQITKVKLYDNNGSALNCNVGSRMIVWGYDDTGTDVYPNLSNGTIFEESDTGKHYMFDGTSAWNEIA
jgi:hypothetical protein